MNQWNPPPGVLTIDEQVVDLWLIQLNDVVRDLDSLSGFLSIDELERAARFKFDKDRQLFVGAHVALRSILSRYLRQNPEQLEFIEGSNGKPHLAEPSERIEFNLSHSHRKALLAVALGREIGVDIEYVKRNFQFEEIAERFFTAREVTALRGLPSHLQRQAFFKCWTSKEAFLKAKGTGLSGKLDEVAIIFDSSDQVRINARVPGWSLTEIPPCVGYEGALVIQGHTRQIRCFQQESPLIDNRNHR
jgi:4'-phosphopantetheinyl transferase